MRDILAWSLSLIALTGAWPTAAQESGLAEDRVLIDNRILEGMQSGAAVLSEFPVFLSRDLLFFADHPAIPIPFLSNPDRILSFETKGTILAIKGTEVLYSKDDPDLLDRIRVYVSFDPSCRELSCAYVFARAHEDKFRYGFRREFLETSYSLTYLPDGDTDDEWLLYARRGLAMRELRRRNGVLRPDVLDQGIQLSARREDIAAILGAIPPEGDLDGITDTSDRR